MKKRIIACVVTAFVLMTLMPTLALANPPTPWNGTYDYSWYSDGPTEFTITTAEQFAGIMAIQNGISQNAGGPNSSSLVGKTVKLGADIVLNADLTWDANGAIQGTPLAWAPISSFSGTFDGNGHTISGMYIDTNVSPVNSYYGLFAYTWRGNIKNLTMTDSYLFARNWNVGGIVAGRNQGGIIENVNVTNSYLRGSSASVSGITNENGVPHEGEPTIGQILNCSVSDTVITGDSNCAGIAQSNINGSIIKNCINSSDITTTGSGGGISTQNASIIDNCTNLGTISTIGTTMCGAMGGIAGRNTAANGFIGTITNCYSNGDVNAPTWDGAGGLVGVAEGQSIVKNSYSVNARIYNIINAGGIVGNLNGGNIENCYSNCDVVSDWGLNSGIASNNSGTVTNCYYKVSATPLFHDTTNIVVTNCGTYSDVNTLVNNLNAWVTANGASYNTWSVGDGYAEFGATEPPQQTNPTVAIDAGVVTVSNAPANCVLIIASYNGTKLIDAKKISEVSTSYIIANEISIQGATEIKAFLWDSIDTIKPLCDAASI